MVYLENSVIGLRSVFFTLRNNTNIMFNIIPLVHIAKKSFYDEVNKILLKSDKIIYESVESDKWYYSVPTYKNIGKELGLISQNEGISFEELDGKLIHADISSEEWNSSVSKLSFKSKLIIFFLEYLLRILLKFDFFKKKFYKMKNVDDLSEKYYNELSELLLEKRNKIIIKKIEEIYIKLLKHDKKYIVTLLYGAKHCPKIVKFLFRKFNYKIRDAEYLMVYDKLL